MLYSLFKIKIKIKILHISICSLYQNRHYRVFTYLDKYLDMITLCGPMPIIQAHHWVPKGTMLCHRQGIFDRAKRLKLKEYCQNHLAHSRILQCET